MDSDSIPCPHIHIRMRIVKMPPASSNEVPGQLAHLGFCQGRMIHPLWSLAGVTPHTVRTVNKDIRHARAGEEGFDEWQHSLKIPKNDLSRRDFPASEDYLYPKLTCAGQERK